MVAEGLRVHICPKVATASISNAMYGTRYRHTFPEESGPEYRFMCVRHPLDRLVSCWAFFCGDEDEINGQAEFRRIGYYYGMPFEEFLELVFARHDENQHTRQQVKFAGPHPIDCLCPIEDLSRQWALLKQQFPMLNRPLIVTHKSNRGGWEDYFTPKTRNRAETFFKDDLQLYERSL